MQKTHITITGEFATMNKIIAASKKHYGAYAAMKKKHTEQVVQQANGISPVKKADFVITWHCKNKRSDPDNIASGVKFLLDGLVEAGVLENDGWGEINSLTHIFRVDKANPRVEVEIFEVKDGINTHD